MQKPKAASSPHVIIADRQEKYHIAIFATFLLYRFDYTIIYSAGRASLRRKSVCNFMYSYHGRRYGRIYMPQQRLAHPSATPKISTSAFQKYSSPFESLRESLRPLSKSSEQERPCLYNLHFISSMYVLQLAVHTQQSVLCRQASPINRH